MLRLDIKDREILCRPSYACTVLCTSPTTIFTVLCLEQIRRVRIGYVVCSIGLACSYDRSRIKHGDIFSRNIRSHAKSKRSRINRPGYFSCFFHYFGSYVHTSNVSGVLSTRLRYSLYSLSLSLPLHLPPFSTRSTRFSSCFSCFHSISLSFSLTFAVCLAAFDFFFFP